MASQNFRVKNGLEVGTGLTITSGGNITAGIISATSFVGNGSLLTNVPGSSNSGYANNAGIATFATNAGVSTYATNAGIATFATSSGIATYATNAGIATYATNAGVSTYATNAGIATYATNAGVSTYATNAGIATFATNAGVSTYATNAGIATFATNAGVSTYATNAGIATFATNAGVSTYATNAGIATFATNAGIATFATNAGIATNVVGGIVSVTQLNVTGVSTFGNTVVGGATTQLIVNGDARITGILTIGTSSLTFDGFNNKINIGTGITFQENGSASFSNGLSVSGVITATSFDGSIIGNVTGTATSTTNIPNLTGDITSVNKATTLATVNSNVGTFGSGGSIPSITVNAKGLVTGVTTTAVNPANDGTLTLAVSGTGLSGSTSFTANQSSNSTFTVTSNATNSNDASTIVARDGSGNFSAGTITATLTGNASSATYTSEWILGANGSSDYTFTGPGLIGAENDITLYLIRGQQYKFTNTMGMHPFRIQSTVNGSTGTQYNDGIANNDVSNGTLTWNVQFDAPGLLYYQCTAHTGMGGKIYIIDAGIGPDISINTTGTITASSFSGNATTATTLQTARTINGISFNGSANILVNPSSGAYSNGYGAKTVSTGSPSGGSDGDVWYQY